MTHLLQVTGLIFPPQLDDFFPVESQWLVFCPPFILIVLYHSRGIKPAGASQRVLYICIFVGQQS
jgi:hypothetical protein